MGPLYVICASKPDPPCTLWERLDPSTTESCGASLVNSVSKFEQSMADVWATRNKKRISLRPAGARSWPGERDTHHARLERRLNLLLQQRAPVDMFRKERVPLDLFGAIDAQPLAWVARQQAPQDVAGVRAHVAREAERLGQDLLVHDLLRAYKRIPIVSPCLEGMVTNSSADSRLTWFSS